jgi:hypothetical protein
MLIYIIGCFAAMKAISITKEPLTLGEKAVIVLAWPYLVLTMFVLKLIEEG